MRNAAAYGANFYEEITRIIHFRRSRVDACVLADRRFRRLHKNSSDEKDYNVQYELDENEEFYTLKGFSISEKARKLADKSDFAALAELFNAYLTNGETPFTADTVKTFTVKSEIDGKPVKKISAGAISSLAFIEKIVVPDSVEEIGANAFYQLSGLKEITLPFVGNSRWFWCLCRPHKSGRKR